MTATIADQKTARGLVSALYVRTKALHTEAERSGIVVDILRGEASRDDYVLFLRNLVPAYRELEEGLARHAASPILGELARYRLDRASAIESDLEVLSGQGWEARVPLLPAAETYAAKIADAAGGDGSRLIAHAYTRYLGDLNGGQILSRLLAKALDLGPHELSFYDFSRFADPDALKSDYRLAIDRAGDAVSDPAAVVEEGALAFSLNIALSEAVQQAAGTTAPAR
ncbi:MAG: biliverdin-producing heme oxygenase [Bradyrhizobiaceae bacterium]|nr:MAG: biliverdin-producing heme oxygenase [Bradyrhizobiaceae bacterium]